jgi:uncharacterized protein (DUF697 family)
MAGGIVAAVVVAGIGWGLAILLGFLVDMQRDYIRKLEARAPQQQRSQP